ncbi:unnamed protein product, partial [Linum tenue]
FASLSLSLSLTFWWRRGKTKEDSSEGEQGGSPTVDDDGDERKGKEKKATRTRVGRLFAPISVYGLTW